VPNVHTPARGRYATQAVDGGLSIATVAKNESEQFRIFPLACANVVQVAFRFHYEGDMLLEIRMGQLHAIVPRHTGISYSREHIGDRIGHHEVTSSP
jgi:hypothetical protein